MKVHNHINGPQTKYCFTMKYVMTKIASMQRKMKIIRNGYQYLFLRYYTESKDEFAFSHFILSGLSQI